MKRPRWIFYWWPHGAGHKFGTYDAIYIRAKDIAAFTRTFSALNPDMSCHPVPASMAKKYTSGNAGADWRHIIERAEAALAKQHSCSEAT